MCLELGLRQLSDLAGQGSAHGAGLRSHKAVAVSTRLQQVSLESEASRGALRFPEASGPELTSLQGAQGSQEPSSVPGAVREQYHPCASKFMSAVFWGAEAGRAAPAGGAAGPSSLPAMDPDPQAGVQVGMRVVRGVDWKWGQQDGGEGGVGTVVELGRHGSPSTPDRTVVVQWDQGTRTNYRAGYQGAHDLLLYDNAQIGIRHPNIICDCCKKHGLRGMRWKCRVCFDYDLCTQCYMHNKHDLTHAFERYETAHSRPVMLGPRQGLPRVPLRGIFQGAKVVRGPDWEWGSQDGGEGKPGRVVDIRGWDVETGRSVASVTWADGTTNVYRVGHKGKVDLKCVGEALLRPGLPPSPGKPAELQRRVSADGQPFQRGNKVKCLLDTEVLRDKATAAGTPGWRSHSLRAPPQFIGQTGTVHRITDRGDVRVQFSHEIRWTFHPGALTKHNSFWVGDVVRVIDDLDTVKQLQAGHGEWTDDMAPALGRVGKVVKVFGDGSLRVAVGGQQWTFSPSCLVAYRPEEDTNLDVAERARENKSSLSVALDKLRAQKSEPEHPGRLVVEAALGNVARALDLLQRHREQARGQAGPGTHRWLSWQVDTRNQGRTALQVATYLGQLELVHLLLQAQADVDLLDEEGNTALHYAALGNQPEAARVLLSAGCGANALNGTRSTALHVAVQRGFLEVVRVLCERGCDVNLPDAHADTPLHSAISAGAGASGIVKVLTEVPGINITATNSQGFTLLHHASLKGHALAVRKILARARQLVDAKKEDGFTALHLAALNNHQEVAQILIQEGRCDVNARNRKLQSPLHLAVQQGHVGLVPLLVDSGCSVNTEDEEGDTALHVALQRHQLLPLVADRAGGDPGPLQLLSRLQALGLPGSTEMTVGAAVACFLALEGADVGYTNHRGRSPLDLASEARVLKTLQGCAQRFRERQAGSGVGRAAVPRLTRSTPNTVTNLHVAAVGPEAAECLVCSELAPLVLFSPCQHRTVCEGECRARGAGVLACVWPTRCCTAECARRMKRCIRCQAAIGKKLRPGGDIQGWDSVVSNGPVPSPLSPLAPRKRRYTLTPGRLRWDHFKLTHKILSFPRNLLSPRETRRGLAAAFRMWSDVSPFSFREVDPEQPSDLRIEFPFPTVAATPSPPRTKTRLVSEGRNVTLRCGQKILHKKGKVYWYKDQEPLEFSYPGYLALGKARLSIIANAVNEGTYTCVVRRHQRVLTTYSWRVHVRS
ncbi:E3 ubiquitin-protein ligase MIB2 [Heterocephalus glaber]|uniref:RING-type E3 ubiquitin transferase n=1 Tax=Heterocephalus glaber TaxID=10181 RepID=G5ATN9_HETGA|nr:E3 ubiquitin-protein ligase MIB2 [Heterocephalus glaber]